MAKTLWVRPGDGREVRLANRRKLTGKNTPAEGVPVQWSIYIERRIACGDLVEVKPAEDAAAAATEEPAAPATTQVVISGDAPKAKTPPAAAPVAVSK